MTMLVILVSLIVASMNVINYLSVVTEADTTLNILSSINSERFLSDGSYSGGNEVPEKPEENAGESSHNREENRPDSSFIPDDFPQNNPESSSAFPDKRPEDFSEIMNELGKRGIRDRMPGNFDIEIPYESRFFTVYLDSEWKMSDSDLSMTASVSEDEVGTYVQKVQSKNSENGFVGNFRYHLNVTEKGYILLFLDCGRKLDTFNRFMLISCLVGVGGCIITFFIFLFASGKIVKPISDSYEKQKMFITDAGHEIKTPLTVISANLELLRTETDDTECINDISSQIQRLTTLTNDLVSLSRMQEGYSLSNPVEIPASEIIEDVAGSFRNAFQSNGKTLSLSVQPLVSITGDQNLLVRLTSILVENALKYSSDSTEVFLSFEKKGKNSVLTVSNRVDRILSPEELVRIFDRFFRTDKSRSSSVGGHGIGLSIAGQIMEIHRGKISACMSDWNLFSVVAVFPE